MKNKRVISILALTAFFLLLLGAGSLSADDKEKYEETFQKTEKLSADGKVYVVNVSGDITVRTWDKAEVKIDALKVSKASSQSRARENADLVTIEVDRTDGILRIETKYPKGSHRNLSVSVKYDLMIPAKASFEAKNVSGDVTVEKAGGAIKLSTVSGDVRLKGALKGADCTVVSGDVRLFDISGNVYAKTVSGDVTVDKVSGDVDAETVSGDVEVTGVSGAKSVRIKVLSGDVDYTGGIEPNGNYNFNSHSGDVTLILPADSAFDLSAESFSGSISTDFKIEIQGTFSKKEIQGIVNGGGAILKVKSFSGDIHFRKR